MLSDRVIVIIGGTSGIGLAGAKACLAAGARVVAAGRDDENAQAARDVLGQDALVLTGDAREPQLAEQAIQAALERFGAMDGLYHVAGGSGRRFGDGPLHEITDEGWRETLRLNHDSLFYSNRAALRHFMERQHGGVILNTTSVLGYSPSPGYFAAHAYAAAKAAIIGMTKSAAAYYAPHNIRINALAPALTDTPMAQRALASEEIMAFARRKQPLDGGRVGLPSDLDGAVVYLLSDAARFVTGQVLAVDGGWSVSEG